MVLRKRWDGEGGGGEQMIPLWRLSSPPVLDVRLGARRGGIHVRQGRRGGVSSVLVPN